MIYDVYSFMVFIIILKGYRSAFSGEFMPLHGSWFIMHDVRRERQAVRKIKS